jgi:hypothetical protein
VKDAILAGTDLLVSQGDHRTFNGFLASGIYHRTLIDIICAGHWFLGRFRRRFFLRGCRAALDGAFALLCRHLAVVGRSHLANWFTDLPLVALAFRGR